MSSETLDPVIHQIARLRVMGLLHRNRAASFVWVRDTLGLTDGNLGSHVERLVAAGYAESKRLLTRSGFQVWLRITAKGDQSYRAYLGALRTLLEPTPGELSGSPPKETDPAGQPRERSPPRTSPDSAS